MRNGICRGLYIRFLADEALHPLPTCLRAIAMHLDELTKVGREQG